MSALIGVLMDVSGSMRGNAVFALRDEEYGSWSKSIFEVLDGLIKHDVSNSNKVVAICFGGSTETEIFDLLRTLDNVVVTNERLTFVLGLRASPSEKVSHIIDILEENGAPYVRKWADIPTILKCAGEYLINAILVNLHNSADFTRYLAMHCLPSQCRDGGSVIDNGALAIQKTYNQGFFGAVLLSFVPLIGPSLAVRAALKSSQTEPTNFVTLNETEEAVKKATTRLIAEVDISNATRQVKQAHDILHRSLEKKDLTKKEADKLLKAVEPFIYGQTPFWEAMDTLAYVFDREKHSCDQNLVFVLSDGEPTDKRNDSLERLQRMGVTIVTMYVSNNKIKNPRKLYSEECATWNEEAKLLFRMSSTLTTQSIPRTIFIRRGWKIDISNNETKLFFQINHPDLIHDVCSLCRDVICCQDALAEVLGSVSLDLHSYMEIKGFDPKEQVGGTCYANAVAAVMHMATRRVVHRRGSDGQSYPNFEDIRQELIREYGTEGAATFQILERLCPKYRLRCSKVDICGAMKAISANRPVVATFRLTNTEWEQFSAFYKSNPAGVLGKAHLDIEKRKSGESLGGHAVVLTSFNSKGLRFMNSWGTQWADGGFFKVECTDVLAFEFMDVFWTLGDILPEEKEAFAKYGNEGAKKLITNLKGLQEAVHQCPSCKDESKVIDFTGSLFQAKCPKCRNMFDTKDTGSSLALSLYFASLSA